MRRKFELLMKDLWGALELPTKQDYPLTIAAWGVRHFSHELVADPPKVRQVIDFIRALRLSGVTGRRSAEEALMESLIDLASQCGGELGSTNCPLPSGIDRTTDATAEQQPMLRVLQELHDFALACFQFKRPRDSFAGTRRGLAFEILGEVGGVVDLPQVVDMARKALKKSKSIESGTLRISSTRISPGVTGRWMMRSPPSFCPWPKPQIPVPPCSVRSMRW